MENINRALQKEIEKKLFHGKVIILYGPRQVGKTTLVKEILHLHKTASAYFSCDEPDVRAALTNKTSTELQAFFGHKRFVVLDEAQRVRNIGLTLKLLVEHAPDIQVIATGSSSFELSNRIIEPLTGRSYEFYLYPFSVEELRAEYGELEMQRALERRIIFGMYPEVVLQQGAEGEETIRRIAQSYVYKDILIFQHIRHSEALEKLLQALALHIGNEVSYTELSQLIGIDKNTVSQYIQILEKAFIIFRLPPFSRNIRNELKKLRKVYFFDTGIRNSLINNFNRLDLRNDTGALWENFVISERIKWMQQHHVHRNMYFWRTHAQQEIDLIEEEGGRLFGFEMKWKQQPYQAPKVFLEHYPGTEIQLIHRENLFSFLHQ